MLKITGALLVVVLACMVAGCWDRKEIENRGFVLGIAIDHVITPGPKGKYDLTQVTQEAGMRKYHVTFELPQLNKREGGRGGSEMGNIILAGEGESLFQVSRAMDAKHTATLFFEDIQVLVFSESVAREGVAGLLDFFARDPDMRRRLKVFVTPGRAEEVLKAKPKTGGTNGLNITRITRNLNAIPRFASKVDFGDITEARARKRSFFTPIILVEEGEIRLSKAAIFNKKGEMVGTIDEWTIVGAKIVNSRLKQGGFSVPHPRNPNKQIVVEIQEAKSETHSHVKDGRVWFSVNANFFVRFAENAVPEQDVLDPAFEKEVEKALADQFTRQVRASNKLAQELHVDPLDMGEILHRQHPEYWRQVKDIWEDEIFPNVPMDIDIKVIIKRPGMIS